ncbi:SCO7613 C-terminal domain-containing membrane protein [Mumia sp. DW29H23]|uniref:SCO7613 C-terminal domain-containing membrane protein n=1 Tax=Mumia sp. DW29H23 TaxID=3421241 RepID=UPI003D694B75
MTYADPSRCPSCGAPASGSWRCARCGIELRGERPLALLRLLGEADSVLAQMETEAASWRREQGGAAAAAAPPAAPPAAAPPVTAPAAPQPPTYGAPPPWSPRHPSYGAPQQPRHTWTVGGTLLALGALCLVVAAFVFVAVTWGRIGLTGRTLILLAVTSAACAAAAWLTTRRLRASAEALWTVTGFLAAFDTGAAMSAGLLGLDEVDGEVVVLGFSVLLAGAGAAVALWSRRWMSTLVSAQLGVAVGNVAAAIALVLLVDVDLRWTLTPVAAAVVLLALLCWRGSLLVAAWVTGLAGASMLGLAALWIVTAVAIAPTFADRWSGGEAPAALLHGAIVVALAAVVAHAFAGHVAHLAVDLIRGIGAFDAAVCLAAVLLLRGDTLHVEAASVTWIAVPLALTLAGLVHARWSRGWETGVRSAAAVAAAPLVGGVLVSGIESLVAVLESWSPGWVSEVGLRLSSDPSLPAGSACALWVGAAVVLAVAAWWPVPSRTPPLRRLLLTSAAVLVVGGLGVLIVLLDAPVVLLALGLLVAAGAAATAWILLPRASAAAPGAAVLAVVCGVLSALVPIGSAGAATLVWSGGAAVAVLVAATTYATRPAGRDRDDGLMLATAAAAALAVAAVVGWTDVAGAGARTIAVVAAALAAVLLLASAVPGLPWPVRLPLEVVAPTTGVVALGFAASVGTAWFSLVLTVLGVAAAAVGLLRADRRAYAWTGAALLGLAYVLRLAAADVGVVEAYTLPFGLILLGIGTALVLKDRARSTDVLWPGLTLVLLPSLPQALGDPTSVRGLLLALAAVAVLAVGAVARWRAPFVVGAVLTGVLVVRWAGPFVGDLPRWIPLGVVGVALVLVGATWEARVRDARTVVAYVQRLR